MEPILKYTQVTVIHSETQLVFCLPDNWTPPTVWSIPPATTYYQRNKVYIRKRRLEIPTLYYRAWMGQSFSSLQCIGSPWDTITLWDSGLPELKSPPFGFKLSIDMYLYEMSLLNLSELSDMRESHKIQKKDFFWCI